MIPTEALLRIERRMEEEGMRMAKRQTDAHGWMLTKNKFTVLQMEAKTSFSSQAGGVLVEPILTLI